MRTWRWRADRRPRGPLTRAGWALSTVLALAPTSGCDRDRPSESSAATLALAPCESVAIADARCGRLSVEEDREAPNGRRIELAILVAPATSRTPAEDPVVLIAGGPGQGAAELGPHIVSMLDPIRRDRPLVFVDLRGTGSANPLDCDAEDPEDLAAMLGAELPLTKLDACLASYGDADLRQYTTAAMVEDLDEVRAALGYERVNLLGISHGSRVALEYLRRHPDRVRAAVLDGVVPPDVPVSLAAPRNAEAALDRLLADCRAEPECAAAFPGLERALDQVLRELDQNRELERLDHPRTGGPIRLDVTRAGFVGVLRGALYAGSYASLIPRVIAQAHAGDYGPLAALALHSAQISKTISLGLYFSVACSEDLRAVDAEARRAAVAGLAVFDDHMIGLLEQVCARWPHAQLEPEAFTPVVSDAPVLMLSGAYDPVTPPSLAEHAGETLARSRSLVAPHASHGVWHQGCAPALMAEFFVDPDPAALDGACLERIPGPHPFLSANGPRRLPTPAPAPEEPAP